MEDYDNQGKLGRSTISLKGYWVIYSQGAYEGAASVDNDPDAELFPKMGMSAGDAGYPRRNSLIFFETIRDVTNESNYDNEYLNLFVALHEIGHQFNLGDDTGCIMRDPPNFDDPTFCSIHIRAIRQLTVPSAPILNQIESK